MPEIPNADRPQLDRLYFHLMRELRPPPPTDAELERALEMFRRWAASRREHRSRASADHSRPG